jgi:hypothetical protein
VRAELAADVVERMQADVAAFTATMKRDTTKFLSRDTDGE